MTNGNQLLLEARRFRTAVESAREAGDFKPAKSLQHEPMNEFPRDCCDDAADLFIHYLYHTFGMDSQRVTGDYYSKRLKCICNHVWQMADGWVVDFTSDQFDNDPAVSIKSMPVYAGAKSDFHQQFHNLRTEHSCSIECLGAEAMNGCMGYMMP